MIAKSTVAKNARVIVAPILMCTTQYKAIHAVPDCVYAACSLGTKTTPSSCGMDGSVVMSCLQRIAVVHCTDIQWVHWYLCTAVIPLHQLWGGANSVSITMNKIFFPQIHNQRNVLNS